MRAVGFLADHIAAKSVNGVERNNDIHICQNQPDVVVGGIARAKLFNLGFEGKQQRPFGRQLGVATNHSRQSNFYFVGWTLLAHKTSKKTSKEAGKLLARTWQINRKSLAKRR